MVIHIRDASGEIREISIKLDGTMEKGAQHRNSVSTYIKQVASKRGEAQRLKIDSLSLWPLYNV